MEDKDLERRLNEASEKLDKPYKKIMIRNKHILKNAIRLALIAIEVSIILIPVKKFNEIGTYNNMLEDLNKKFTNTKIKDYCSNSDIEYENVFEEYDEIVENTARFLQDKLIIDNPIDAFICYNFMVNNGYLSNSHTYIYEPSNSEILGHYGLSMLNGEGVCRNNSNMLTDILNAMGLNSSSLVCNAIDITVPNLAFSVYYNSKDFTFNNDNIGIVIDTGEKANHSVTVTYYNNLTYIFDPTNDCLYIKDKNEYINFSLDTKEVNSNYKIKPSIWSSYILGYSNKEDFFNLEYAFNIGKNVCTLEDIDLDKLKESYEKFYNDPANQHFNIYDGFYRNNFDSMRKIKLLEKIKED